MHFLPKFTAEQLLNIISYIKRSETINVNFVAKWFNVPVELAQEIVKELR